MPRRLQANGLFVAQACLSANLLIAASPSKSKVTQKCRIAAMPIRMQPKGCFVAPALYLSADLLLHHLVSQSSITVMSHCSDAEEIATKRVLF